MKRTWNTGVGISAKAIAVLVVGMLTVVAAWYFGLRPVEADTVTLNATAADVRADNRDLAARLTALRDAGPDAAADLETKLRQATAALPGDLNPYALVNVLVSDAQRFGVTLELSYSGSDPAAVAGAAYSIPFTGTAAGNREALGAWLTALDDLTPLVTVTALNASSLDGRGAADVTLRVWGFGDPATGTPGTPSGTPTTGDDDAGTRPGTAEDDLIDLVESGN